jgi:cytochrome c
MKKVFIYHSFHIAAVKLIVLVLFFSILIACKSNVPHLPTRAMDPWAFRSVLDKNPRMLTLAMDDDCFVAYDLARCTIYKAWKGGVTLEGAAYTDKKNVQPTSWGRAYFNDSLHLAEWSVTWTGKQISSQVVSKGYHFDQNRITLDYQIGLSTDDTIMISEQPEVVFKENGNVGLQRIFKTTGVPPGVSIVFHGVDGDIHLKSNASTTVLNFYEALPPQVPPIEQAEYDHRGRYWMEKSDCMTCHEYDIKTVGPSFQQIANQYPNEKSVIERLSLKVKQGGSGTWGTTVMNAHPQLAEKELKEMVAYILALKLDTDIQKKEGSGTKSAVVEEKLRPGFGASLEGIHPSYTVSTIHPAQFKPRVGGLAFMPDGRLLVTTWDAMGAVYMLDGVETGDTNKIKVTRIASGLAEPLGIEVVDGEVYVLQKQELTKLIDTDGDGIIDVYKTICNGWGVTADFHEFAFGLVYKDGFFYVTLSMAMRLMSYEKQKPDRGRTIKIAKDGSFEWVNFGLRTPNGIGLGVDNEIFVTDNQGEWEPGNKLIHVKKGDYHGMRWGLPDSLPSTTPVATPVIWLPENEIGNSPSEPVLIHEGPYKGQMLHGDVTHGGIKRDFIEKIKGQYQGAVFRFSQGLEAGVNRLRWGPDGALYIGGVGMVGGWSWQEKQYGLQRMQYNGKKTFEMLAVRLKENGFEIELTEPIKENTKVHAEDFLIHQWWYLPTANYGGPKMDLENLKITHLDISGDRTRLLLDIKGMKKEHVIYLRLPADLNSETGHALWSSEAWYTLNNFVD